MATAKCFKCGGSAIADTFEQARKLINHAVGLSRGIKCGDNYNRVKNMNPVVAKPVIKTPTPKTETKTETQRPTFASSEKLKEKVKEKKTSESKKQTFSSNYKN